MKRLWKLLMGLIVAALGLVGLQLGALALEYIRYGTIRVHGKPVGLYADDRMPGQGARLQPGAVLNGWQHRVSINSLGFRGAELEAPRRSETTRIWCTGGSTTFDILVSDDPYAWPARLQHHLREQGAEVEVVNAGVPGEVLSTNLRDLKEKYEAVRPDVLVIYTGVNDLRHISADIFGPPPMVQRHTMLGELSLYRQLTDLLPAVRTPESWKDNVIPATAYAPLEQRFRSLMHEAQRRRMQVVLASHGHRGADDASEADAHQMVGDTAGTYRMSATGLIAAYRQMNTMLATLAQRERIPFVDIRTAVGSDPSYWDDGIHFSNSGADVAGKAFADAFIQERGRLLR